VLCYSEMDQFTAAREGKLQELQRLLTPDNVDDVSGLGKTALHFAARYGHVECVKWCLKMRANVNVQDRANFGARPLRYASLDDHVDVVRVLLDAGALVDVADDVGRTPLYYAIFGNNVHVTHILIDRGAKVSNVKLPTYVQEIPDWVTAIVASRSNCRCVIITIMGVHKYRDSSVTGNNDNNVMKLICKHVWSMRMDDVWVSSANSTVKRNRL
jgi:ankyrin repeat protein